MMEIVAGLVFVSFAMIIPRVFRSGKIKNGSMRGLFGRLKRGSKKKDEEKEIDEALEKVVSEKPRAEEKFIPLDNAAKNVEVTENLLDEMETGTMIKTEDEEEKLPELPDLPELTDETGEINMEDVEKEITDFEEEDNLILSLAKEIETKEKEEIDLLRNLKGKKFSAEELEKELLETLERLKRLKR
uniref:Uncharacterized protein n=1 Tax=Geoglobus ahangari TaxID=113653 RepID=A0A7C4WL32_9EURY